MKPDSPTAAHLRRTTLLAGSALALEAALYSAAIPLLPYFADRLALSRLGVGVLASSYAVGQIVGAMAAGTLLASGGRRTSGLGFVLLAACTAGFGVAHTVVALDCCRFGEGVGGGLAWVGALTWLLDAAGRERRGRAIGSSLTATLIGGLVGPAIGSAGRVAGVGVVFAALAGCVIAIGIVVLSSQPPGAGGARPNSPYAEIVSLRGRPLPLLLAMNLLPGVFFGATSLIVPLRLAAKGAGAVEIGATFVLAAMLSACLGPRLGSLYDRRGPRGLLLSGLALLCAGSVLIAVADAPLTTALGALLVSGVALTAFTVPAMGELTVAAAARGAPAAMTMASLNLAFALGEVLGAQGAGIASELVSEAFALSLLAATGCVGMIAYATRRAL
ncbi:MAG: MFS transporter [Deltaproteobacteria bacterium]